MIIAADDEEESIKKMGVGRNENRVEVVNTTIDMDNNNDGDKNGKDGSKDNEYYDDEDDDNDEDDENDDGEENDNKNNDATDREESDDEKWKNDGIGSAIVLDKRVHAAIDTLRNKCEKIRY